MLTFLVIAIVTLLICMGAIALKICIDRKIKYNNLAGKHVVITGGSSGIGKAAALEAARLGAHVSIIGRDVNKLKEAVNEISSQCIHTDQKIQPASLDITTNYENIKTCIANLEEKVGPIFMLINCAGMCICGEFENMKPEDIKTMIDLNYLGTAYPTKCVLPGMKERDEGIIVFVSTEAALLGIYGYGAYGAAKWAVRGLAEALTMELVGSGVRVTLSFPPDTDTPGFKVEEETKPEATKLISGAGGLLSADKVGTKLVHDALDGKVYSVYGTSGKLMTTLFCGSIESVTQVLMQVFTMGCLRVVMVYIIVEFQGIVRNSVRGRRRPATVRKDY